MDQKEFEALMARRKAERMQPQSIGNKVRMASDDSVPVDDTEGLGSKALRVGSAIVRAPFQVKELAKGIARAPISIATTPVEGLDIAGRIAEYGGRKLASKVTGASEEELVTQEKGGLSNLQDAIRPQNVAKGILKRTDALKQWGPIAPSDRVTQGWETGIYDPEWWAGNVGEAAAYSGYFMRSAHKYLKKNATKQMAVLSNKQASKTAKRKAQKEIAKMASKSVMTKAATVEGMMSHGEYRNWEKENPDDATLMGDLISTTFGAVAGSVEGWTAGSMIMRPFINKFGKAAGPKAAARFMVELAKAFPKNTLKEGMTEGFQEAVGNIGKKLGYEPDQELTEGIVEAMILGGAVGGGFSVYEAKTASTGTTQAQKDFGTLKKSQDKIGKLKVKIEEATERYNNTEEGTPDREKAERDLQYYDTRLQKQEAIVDEMSSRILGEVDPETGERVLPELADESGEVTVADEEAFGTTVDPSMTIEDVAVGIDEGAITKEQWDNTNKGIYTDEEIAIVEEHLQEKQNIDDIEKMAAGEELIDRDIDEKGVSLEQDSLDGTDKSLWQQLPEDYTDEDAVSALVADLNTSAKASGIKVPKVTLSKTAGKNAEVVSQLSDILGVRIVRVDMEDTGSGTFNGVMSNTDDKLFYINAKSSRPEMWIMGHEFGHSLKRSNPDAYQVLLDVAAQEIDPKEVSKYRKQQDKALGLKSGTTTTNAAVEDMLGDFMGDRFSDTKFWSNVHKNNPTKFKEIITAVKDYIKNIMANFTGQGGKADKFFSDMVKLDETLTNVINKHVGYTGAVTQLQEGEVDTREVKDLGKDGKHMTSIQLGDTGTMMISEDESTIRIHRFSRAGSQRGTTVKGLAETNEDKGTPTAALNELKAYAKESGKTITAEVRDNNKYLANQNFVSTGVAMTWKPENDIRREKEDRKIAEKDTLNRELEEVTELLGQTGIAEEERMAAEDKLRALLLKKREAKGVEAPVSIDDVTDTPKTAVRRAKEEERELIETIQDDRDLAYISTSREVIQSAREAMAKNTARMEELAEIIKAGEKATGEKSLEATTFDELKEDKTKINYINEITKTREEIINLEKGIEANVKLISTSESRKEIAAAKKENDNSILRIEELEKDITSFQKLAAKQAREKKDDTKKREQVRSDGQQGTKGIGSAQDTTKGKETSRSDRDIKSEKGQTLTEKIKDVKKEAEYKKQGVAGALTKIADKLNKDGMHGDMVAFMNHVHKEGIDPKDPINEQAFQRVLSNFVKGEEADATPVKKKKPKAKKQIRTTKERIELGVLSAMMQEQMSGSMPKEGTKEYTERVAEITDDVKLRVQQENEENNAAGIKKKEKAEDNIASMKFSAEERKQVDANEVFVSNISQKIKDLKLDIKLPKKQSSEDWISTLTKLSRKGKINPEELEFTYVKEWLNSEDIFNEYPDGYTREDVLGYIKNNAPYVTSKLNDPTSDAVKVVTNNMMEAFNDVSIGKNFDAIIKLDKRINADFLNKALEGIKPDMTPEQRLTHFRNHPSGKIIFNNMVKDEVSIDFVAINDEYNAEANRLIDEYGGEAHEYYDDMEKWLDDEYNLTFDELSGGVWEQQEGEGTSDYSSLVLPGGTNYGDILIKYNPKDGEYKESGAHHWPGDDTNNLAHLRFGEHQTYSDIYDQKSVFLMYEAQSDWASDRARAKINNKERDKYNAIKGNIPAITKKVKNEISTALSNTALSKSVKRMSALADWAVSQSINDNEPVGVFNLKGLPDDVLSMFDSKKHVGHTLSNMSSLSKTYNMMYNDISGYPITEYVVPDSPFNKTWPLLTFKHALVEAYNRGMDYIAWPSTRDQLAMIERWPMDREGKRIVEHYTKTMPRQVGEFVKQYGGKVEEIYLEQNEDPVLAVEITPQMEEIVRNKQMMQFSAEPLDPKSTIPGVDERTEKAKTLATRSLGRRLKDTLTASIKSFTSPVSELVPGKYGYAKDRIRLAKEVDKFGSREAFRRIYTVINKLSPDEQQVFTMNLILSDMIFDTAPNENGVALLKDGHLPFGYKTVANVRADLRHFREQARKSPRIMTALARRRKMMGALRDKLIKRGFIPKELANNDAYFHHLTLEKLSMGDDYMFGIYKKAGDKDVSWAHERGGTIKSYSTDYIVSEFSVISNAIATMELSRIKDQLRAKYDITEDLKKKSGSKIVEPPKGFTTFLPSQRLGWGASPSFPDAVMDNVIQQAKIDPEIKRQMQIASGNQEAWIIPEKLANGLSRIREVSHEGMPEKVSNYITQSWKKWTLINPLRVVGYNIRNMAGDVDIAMAYDWRIMKYTKQAMADLAGDIDSTGTKLPFNMQRYGTKLSAAQKVELKEAHRLGVIGAGFVMHEVTDIAGEFESLMRGPQGNPAKRFGMNWWQASKDATNYRENILRLASYRYFKDRLAKGEPGVYGASNPAEIDEITNMNEKAAKLSRELIGDYGRLSESGEWMRKHLIPFYSWMEINAPRYVRMMRNLKHEGGPDKKGIDAKTAVGITWKASVLGAKFYAFTAMITAWNVMMFGEEEEELQGYQKKQMHLLLGRRADGSIRSLPLQGAFRDALSWFGGESAYYDLQDYLSGDTTPTEMVKKTIMAAPLKMYTASRPFFRAGTEVLYGSAMFPDPHNPRPITDNWEYLSKTFSADLIYRWAMGKPTRGFAAEMRNKLYYNVSPGESAYYAIKDKIRNYNKKVGYIRPTIIPSKDDPVGKRRAYALRNYKQSLRLVDVEATEKFLKMYWEADGSIAGLRSSFKLSKPTGGLRRKDRSGFYRTLTKKDKELLNLASKWYRQTYKDFGKKP